MSRRPSTTTFLRRLAAALGSARVRLTWKAEDEVVELGWSPEDAFDQLALLTPAELLRTERSNSPDYDVIWVFCPLVPDLDRHLWIRLAERPDSTIVVSFHLAQGDPWT